MAQSTPAKGDDIYPGSRANLMVDLDQNRSKEELHKSERLLQGSIDALPDHIAILDANGMILNVNKAWRNYADKNEFRGANYGIGLNYVEVCSPSVGEHVAANSEGGRAAKGIRDVIAERTELFSLEYPCHEPAEQLWFQMRVTKFDDDGETRVVVAHQNITARYLAERGVRESEERYRVLFDSIDEGFALIDMILDDAGTPVDYRFVQANPAFSRLTGLPQEAVGKTARELVPNLEEFWFEVYGNVALTGESVRFENYSEPMGRWFDVFASRVGNQADRRVAVVFNNITERRRISDELQQTNDRLEYRVKQRTGELARTNKALSAEILERRELEKARVELVHMMVTTQEEERKRISRDLHDQLGQRLTALRLKLSALRDITAEQDDEVTSLVARLQEIADTLDNEVSFLATQLRPTALDDLGLEETLRAYAAEWMSHYETPLEFHSNFGPKRRVDNAVETHLYRIAQEALNNVIKHAKATHVAVLLEKTADGVVLVVEDNGSGFDAEKTAAQKSNSGLGLVGMRERANLIGGEIEIETRSGAGTAIYVKVPDQKAEAR